MAPINQCTEKLAVSAQNLQRNALTVAITWFKCLENIPQLQKLKEKNKLIRKRELPGVTQRSTLSSFFAPLEMVVLYIKAKG